MNCPRGNATPNAQTKLRLFADSGGRCQNPNCLADLFVTLGDTNIHIAEMAHVFGASDEGPRAEITLSAAQRGAYENLILLCPTCHAKVDKAEKEFPDSLILKWKQQHKNKIQELFGVIEYGTRQDARAAIEPLLEENRLIFEEYGPETPERYNPESDAPSIWKRKIITRILPNNRQLLRILDRNRRHLREDELRPLEAFRQHVDDFEAKHLGESSSSGMRFPAAFSKILQ
jgi:hypothetical protein